MAAGTWFIVDIGIGSFSTGRGSAADMEVIQVPLNTQLYKDTLAEVKAGHAEGPFRTRAAAEAALPKAKKKLTSTVRSPKPVNPLTGLAAIGDFFSRLSEANTWLRVGETLLGLILMAIGVARLTHAVPAATKIARMAGTVALA